MSTLGICVVAYTAVEERVYQSYANHLCLGRHKNDGPRTNSGSLAILAAIRRVSFCVSFVVLCVMVLCVPMVPLARNSLPLGVRPG
jgi:hypothetical protein